MQYGAYEIEITNRDKMYYPEKDITKGDLIEYYDKISDYFLPYLKNRPLTLSRFPDGIQDDGFYQKEVDDHYPEWIESVDVEKKEGGFIRQVVCNDEQTLIYLVNQGTLSFHPWLSTISDLDKPDKLVFDLDPPQGNFELVKKGAKALRNLLEDKLELKAFVMATGSEGLHVICPIQAEKSFEEVRAFAKGAGEYLVRENPDDFTVEMNKDQRKERLFIDYANNAYGQASISPYSVRAVEGAPIATPLDWEELENDDLTSQSYHIKNIFGRLSQKDDAWEHFREQAQSLDDGIDKLEQLADDTA